MLPRRDNPEEMIKWLRDQGTRSCNRYFNVVADEFESLVRLRSELEKAHAEAEHVSIQG